MQGRECCVSNEIIYLWKPTPAPGPKPIYQVWAAGGSGPGAINLPPVSPPVLHHAPLPLVPLLGLVRPPFLLSPRDNNPPRRCKATPGSGWNNSNSADQGHGYKSQLTRSRGCLSGGALAWPQAVCESRGGQETLRPVWVVYVEMKLGWGVI